MTQTPSQIALANFRSFAAATCRSDFKLTPAEEAEAKARGYEGYVTPAELAAQAVFAQALADAAEDLLKASAPSEHDAAMSFVVDMVAELLGFALGAGHTSGFCVECVRENVKGFSRTLIQTFRHAVGEQSGDVGHA